MDKSQRKILQLQTCIHHPPELEGKGANVSSPTTCAGNPASSIAPPWLCCFPEVICLRLNLFVCKDKITTKGNGVLKIRVKNQNQNQKPNNQIKPEQKNTMLEKGYNQLFFCKVKAYKQLTSTRGWGHEELLDCSLTEQAYKTDTHTHKKKKRNARKVKKLRKLK